MESIMTMITYMYKNCYHKWMDPVKNKMELFFFGKLYLTACKLLHKYVLTLPIYGE